MKSRHNLDPAMQKNNYSLRVCVDSLKRVFEDLSWLSPCASSSASCSKLIHFSVILPRSVCVVAILVWFHLIFEAAGKEKKEKEEEGSMGSGYYGQPNLGNERSSSSGSSRKGSKKGNSDKPKQPQRGLGVAQLEKIRLHSQMGCTSYLPSVQNPYANHNLSQVWQSFISVLTLFNLLGVIFCVCVILVNQK